MITNATPIYITLILEAIFWFSAYVLVVRRSFKDKSYGMPIFAMAGNITWEFILAAGFVRSCPYAWSTCPETFFQSLNLISMSIDVLILITILKYGRNQFSNPFIKKYFYPIIIYAILTFFTMQLAFMKQFGILNPYSSDPQYIPVYDQGGPYTGFALAMMMGILLINMLVTREDLSGQSLYIGVCMLLGNFFAYILWNVLGGAQGIITVLYVNVFFVNVVYIVMYYQKAKSLGVNPFKRF